MFCFVCSIFHLLLDRDAEVLYFEPGDKRPKNHCQICWQSRARGSGFNHAPCQNWIWDKAVETTSYILPLLRDVTEEIDDWASIADNVIENSQMDEITSEESEW